MLLPNCGFGGALLLRVGTGCAMALVYPMACKVAASWFVENRGLAIGFVVGSVGLGSSSPHLVNVFFSKMPWGNVLLGTASKGGSCCDEMVVLFCADNDWVFAWLFLVVQCVRC